MEYPNSTIIHIEIDLKCKLQIENAITNTKEKFNQIHIIINAAGIMNDNDIDMTLNINVVSILSIKHKNILIELNLSKKKFFFFIQNGVMLMGLNGMAVMDKKCGGEGGWIINISSLVALSPIFSMPIYTASKFAVLGFTKCMGVSLLYDLIFVLIFFFFKLKFD